MYNYIPHPSNARNVGGLLRLRIELGAAGYGIYWQILELLRDADGLCVQNYPRAVAFAINEADVALVERVLSEFGLFDVTADNRLHCTWLDEQMGAYNEKKQKLQEAGRRGAAARYGKDSQAIATPLATPTAKNSTAIASNPILPNETQENATQCKHARGQAGGDGLSAFKEEASAILAGDKALISSAQIDEIAKRQPHGHAPAYVLQECQKLGISWQSASLIIRASEGAALSNDLYTRFVAICKRVEKDRFRPNHPDNYILAKLGLSAAL